jgi:DNA-binding HxlR family transcriptional regulator
VDTDLLAPDVFNNNCPSRVVLDRIGDKWTGLVVLALSKGPMRFTQLRNRIQGVTPKVLTQTLRTLERDGLVTRTVYAEVPPRVEYALTPLGQSLRKPLDAVQRWAESHVAEITAHRDRFDERPA